MARCRTSRRICSASAPSSRSSRGHRARSTGSGKFVRRHRLGVAAATTVMLVLIAFAATMAMQARRIARERDRANWEAATAKQVSDFLVGLFKVSDPNIAQGNTLTARQILESGAANIERDLAGQPEVQARIMATMGIVFTSLGLYDRAESLLKRAVMIDERVVKGSSCDPCRCERPSKCVLVSGEISSGGTTLC